MAAAKLPWSEEEMEVFTYCCQRVAEGCKTSTEMEEDIRRKFWWVTATNAYHLVRTWFRNRQDIQDILNMRAGVSRGSPKPEASTIPIPTSESTPTPASDTTTAPE